MAPLLGVLIAALAASPARASCGASSCELEASGAVPRAARSVRLGYEFEFAPQDRRWAGRGAAPSGVKGGHHDEVYSTTRVHRLSAAVGLTRDWSVSAQLPLIDRAHGHIHNHRGGRVPEAWSVSGLGDALLEARYAFWRSPRGAALSLAAGTELPTGRDGAVNAAGAPAEAGVLPGSGSYDATLSIVWQRPVGRGGLFASATRRFNGPGEKGYRLGDVTMLHAGGSLPPARRLSAMLQANVVLRARDFGGATREETANTGGEALLVSPGLEFAPRGSWTFSAAVQLPIYQRVNGFQIVSGYALRTGFGYRFSY
ncbi:MAG: hypothetical protein HYZ75_03560 [Elusimicrobia bacterium]|nr:hypothetical protein [Elusimicrobiota bacterium]